MNPAEEGAEAANPQFCTCGDHRVAVTGAGAVIGLAAAPGAVVGAAAAPVAASGILGMVGFGAQGIVAGALIVPSSAACQSTTSLLSIKDLGQQRCKLALVMLPRAPRLPLPKA